MSFASNRLLYVTSIEVTAFGDEKRKYIQVNNGPIDVYAVGGGTELKSPETKVLDIHRPRRKFDFEG